MTTPTADNLSGITSFDVTAFAELPEWHALTEALNVFVGAANRRGGVGGQRAWLEALHHHATALPFAGCCSQCRDQGHIGAPVVVPAVARLKGSNLRAGYICSRGHHWSTSYDLAFVGVFA